ncbi:hypothetical protein [Cellulosimicrobium arenosum]|uniref:Uncharacterized protein n=1 Tax=Cellulosimicrobium arenosum TaxID=2708133 RepID=A0A927IY67_9MICO|nr:hypothetical protein [Cellulosimicrobium arenosum]MBD8077545.1 hypothetical protein [Cellulosimicrobium arenosum]
MIRAQWVWELLDADGMVVPEPVSPVFTAQFDAEQWLGETWRGLAGDGVAVVRLLHDGAQATPPVDLRAG